MSVDITSHSSLFGTAPQILPDDLAQIKAAGFASVINNRPDFEGGESQPTSDALAVAALAQGLQYSAVPFSPSHVTQTLVEDFARVLADLPKPVLAFCRTGTRSTNIYQAAIAMGLLNQHDLTLVDTKSAGAVGVVSAQNHNPSVSTNAPVETSAPTLRTHDVVIVGGGSAGIALAASLLKRQPKLDLAIIEPSEQHYYQAAWTLVGAGEFDVNDSVRHMHAVIPNHAKWIKAAVTSFAPDANTVVLNNGEHVQYQQLVVASGLACLWDAIEGLSDTLGQNNVTSNYRADLAPYTWTCVQNMRAGLALFTQPMVPIKCAGAPQKALYLSAAHWEGKKRLADINIEFHNAGGVLFSVPDFIPNLTAQMAHYGAQISFGSNLIKVDGPNKKAWFESKSADGQISITEKSFEMLHVVPPQKPHAFIRDSALANADGWVEVNPDTLQHVRYSNVFGVGDAMSAPNSKTAAAIRKQVVVVAENLLASRAAIDLPTIYDGYSACPITVGHGRLILAEFGYAGKLMPTFGMDPTVPRKLGWYMKKFLFPWLYWHLMLKGHEWLARPQKDSAK